MTKIAQYRKDYQTPSHIINSLDLIFKLDATETIVEAISSVTQNKESSQLILNGEGLSLLKLEINEQETTSDGLFTIELVNCIGACALAPAIMINGDVYGNITTKEVNKIIDKLKNV